jgi:hypothetical protein
MQQLRTLVLPPGEGSGDGGAGGRQALGEDKMVAACAFIKLYCAMKSIAAMR